MVVTKLCQEGDNVFLKEELCTLLAKEAIEHVPLPERDTGFYSLYFKVPIN